MSHPTVSSGFIPSHAFTPPHLISYHVTRLHTVSSAFHTRSAALNLFGVHAHLAPQAHARTHMTPQVAIARAGGIEPLVALARDGTAVQKEHAAGALLNLACNDDNQVAIMRLGWRLCSSDHFGMLVREPAVEGCLGPAPDIISHVDGLRPQLKREAPGAHSQLPVPPWSAPACEATQLLYGWSPME